MKNADRGQATDLDGKGLDIGIVCTRFNAAVVDAMLAACEDELKTLGVNARSIEVVRVPGALEVPLALKVLAERDDFDALIALGCVIRGETYHFELVADQSGAGVMRVSLDHQIPIANAILTVENDEQARARIEDKSRDAARVAVEMANLMDELT